MVLLFYMSARFDFKKEIKSSEKYAMNLFYNIKKFWYAKYVRRLQKYATNLWARNLFCSHLKKYVQKISDERNFHKWELGLSVLFWFQ